MRHRRVAASIAILASIHTGVRTWLAFVSMPGSRSTSGHRIEPDAHRWQPPNKLRCDSSGAEAVAGAALVLALAARLGSSKNQKRQPAAGIGTRELVQRQVLPQVDWLGSATKWDSIEEKPIGQVDFRNVHGVFSLCSLALFAYQMVRIAMHQAPSVPEVWITTAIYLPWTAFCWRDTCQLEDHYKVTFYASCGWAIMALASLHSVVYQDQYPDIAFQVLAAGNIVFAVSCIYFYSYHWLRMWRHYQQNRFRPLWIPGLLGLMCLHGLTIADFAKRIDDMGWWKTVCLIYPDEWWWVADVRIIELFVTAAALWLIILHIQGVFTGMKNAALVVIGTIFTPLVVMVLESTWLRASSWQHYLMVGPKYWG